MKNGSGLAILRTRISRARCLPLFFLLAIAVTVKADDFTYTINLDGTVTITRYTGSDDVIVIPASIEGKLVTDLGNAAFDSCASLTAISVDDGNSVYSSLDGVLFNKSQTTLIRYPAGKAGTYAIPNTVVSIGYKAFQRCTSLTGVTIPYGVITIGAYAFQYCTNLASMTIPLSVTSIGYKTFDYCTSLTAIYVNGGNSVYSSVDGVFFNKNQTTLIQYPAGKAGTYSIPNSVTSVGGYAFDNCTSLTSVTIPSGVITIGAYAFHYCTNLTSITIPSSIASIGNSAFDNCAGLTIVMIPYSVTNIGDKAFDSCARLTAISVDGGNSVYSSVDGVLFNKNQTALIQCPAGKAGTYSIPNTVASVGSYSFNNCTSLTSITIPPSVASVGNSAFDNCVSLTSITIPYSVTSIGDKAFDSCTNLTMISVDGGNSVYSSVDGVLFNKDQTALIQCPAGKAGTYSIPNTVTSVGSYAFNNCVRLTSITIPYSVTSIGYKAFDSCANLTAIYVNGGNSVYSSVDGVLFNKNQTTLIQYPAGKAGTYSIPNTVTNIGHSAFNNCVRLTSMVIPYSITSIGDKAFDSCTNLTTISVDGGNPIFSSMEGVLFNKNQTTLIQYPAGKAGTYAIPNTITSVGNSAFDNCASLTKVTIPSGVTSIENNAFNNYSSLISVTIPNTVASIGDRVFSSCASLVSVMIGNSVISIGDVAFSHCTSLMGIYFEGNAPSLGSGVFDAGNHATIYYLPGTTGWGPTFGGLQTAPWDNTIGPSIKANGTAGTITINYPGSLSITVSMNAGDYVGIPVDWWAIAHAGSSWYYLNSSIQWTQFDGNLLNCHPVHQGVLFNLPAMEVLNITGLPIGSYKLWFAVNYPMNGTLDITKPMLVDSVEVTIQ